MRSLQDKLWSNIEELVKRRERKQISKILKTQRIDDKLKSLKYSLAQYQHFKIWHISCNFKDRKSNLTAVRFDKIFTQKNEIKQALLNIWRSQEIKKGRKQNSKILKS